MPQLKFIFGKRLQFLRIRAGLTQEQMADQLEVTKETISNLERGVHGPKFDTLEKIAKVLNVPVIELFDFK